MEFQEAERRYRELRSEREQGALDDAQFRLRVADLLLRDANGTFWMLDAESGAWYSNRGSGWQPADPRLAWPAGDDTRPLPSRRLRVLLFVLPIAILLAAGGLALWQTPALPWQAPAATATPEPPVQVVIASPGDGDEVPLGQEVRVELTLSAGPGLEMVDRVELRVDGRTVREQVVRTSLPASQATLPLSLPWRPDAVGRCHITIVALSAGEETLGSAQIELEVAELSAPAVPRPACILQAAFLSDVTVPPGEVLAPGARADKVWQVRNSGTCAWGMGYELVLVSGDDDLRAGSPVRVPPTPAGQPSDLAVTFWAPGEAGVYSAIWRLRSPQGELFGPLLSLQIQVKVEAERSVPPARPARLEARAIDGGKAVELTWLDLSENEDAFRVHRQDVEASVGLVPANAQAFVDRSVACGGSYRYSVVAFNAAGASSPAEAPEITMPACAAGSVPLPTLILTVVPTQVVAGEPFNLIFQAEDTAGLVQVTVQGQDTGDPELDEGQSFACEGHRCAASWSLTWDGEPGQALTFVAEAWNVAGVRSEPARVQVTVGPAP